MTDPGGCVNDISQVFRNYPQKILKIPGAVDKVHYGPRVSWCYLGCSGVSLTQFPTYIHFTTLLFGRLFQSFTQGRSQLGSLHIGAGPR